MEQFTTLFPGSVRIYSCGPTVYNYAHIGNLRAYIFTDTLKKVMQWKGYDVLHVMNITDVGHLTSDADEGEDKLERAAQKSQRSVWDIAEFYTRQFQSDLQQLNIDFPAVWTKATDHIQEMIQFAALCEQRGYAYLLDDGLYFDTSKVPNYGALAMMDLEGQEAGIRVAVGGKRNPPDFALWRLSPPNTTRLMEWNSPWGLGAPGWHLECSVMSIKYLGSRFDIHTGGIDHRQIHHCNEIAQNQAYLGDNSPAASFWLHNEFVNMGQQKMSKSSGQFATLQSLIDAGIHPLVYRYFCLMATYRAPLDFSLEGVIAARTGLVRLLKRIEALKNQAGDLSWATVLSGRKYSRGGSNAFIRQQLENQLSPEGADYIRRFDAAVSDDLNTPQGLATMSEVVSSSSLAPDVILRLVASFDLVLGLGLLELNPAILNLRPVSATIDEDGIVDLLEQRKNARAKNDFQSADAIRVKLTDHGVAVMDSPGGATWEWVPR